MGIRFYCPNGHKLNVKSHLAGKRGFCPHCGVKLLIPLRSMRPGSSQQQENNNDDALADEKKWSRPVQNFSGFNTTHESLIAINTETTEISEQTAEQPGIKAPQHVWYVQYPNGERFGPATEEIIQDWIAERRISPTMLVWQEGWRDWVPAGTVFPELNDLFSNTSSQDRTLLEKLGQADPQKQVFLSKPKLVISLLVFAVILLILFFMLRVT